MTKRVSYGEMAALAQHWCKALNIRAIDADARVVELSGGNQQKVVIAKSLVRKLALIDATLAWASITEGLMSSASIEPRTVKDSGLRPTT